MAKSEIIETGVGYVPQGSVYADAEGKFSDAAIARLVDHVEELRQAVNGHLSFGDGTIAARAGNLNAQNRRVIFPGADEWAQVTHGLGRNPAGFIVTDCDRACRVYSVNRSGWGPEYLFLASDVAGADVSLIVF